MMFLPAGLGLVAPAAGGGGGGAWVTAQSWSPDTSVSGWSGYNIRVRIQAAQILAGSKFRLTLDNSGFPINMQNCYIETRDMAGDQWDFSTTPVPVTFGGSASISSAGGTFVSDEIDLVQSATSDIVISAYFNGETTLRERNSALTGWAYYFKAGANEASTPNVSGYSGVARATMFSLVEVFQP